MSRTTRRTLAFDAMEGRVLLSSGLADPAAVVHRAAMAHRTRTTATPFLLNGALMGIPLGTVSPDGINVGSFTLVGRAHSMGRVAGSLTLNDTLISPGKKPDLSNATLSVSNMRGSVQLKMASSPSNRYVFIVTSGAGAYASALGSGTAVVSFNQRLHEYQVVLHSSTH